MFSERDSMEDVLALFELHWRRGERPSVREWTEQRPQLGLSLFFELVLYEFQLLSSDYATRRSVEQHLECYFEFIGDAEMTLALIAVDSAMNPKSSGVKDYANRFPSLADDIRALVDCELSASSLPPPGSLSLDGYVSIGRETFGEVDAVSPPVPPGTPVVVRDTYVVENLHDEGGMKWVHAADQVGSGRKVALKTSKNRDATRMLNEGRLLARLEHPNIPPIVMLGHDETQQAMLAEVLIRGETWAARLADEEQRWNGLAAEERTSFFRDCLHRRIEILKTICLPLQYAHETHRIIHADIKPHNVMLGLYGEVYLLDWGLAVQVGEKANPHLPIPHRSETIGRRGTMNYAAPELIRADASKLSAATDVFLLGAVLYESLVGKAPYGEQSKTEHLLRYLGSRDVLTPLPASTADRPIPAELTAIAVKAMQLNPVDRYGSIAEFSEALRVYQQKSTAREIHDSARSELIEVRSRIDVYRAEDRLHEVLTPLIGVADRFRQADRTWSEGRAVERFDSAVAGERETRAQLLQLAEQSGDYALAISQVDELSRLAPFDQSVLSQTRRRIQASAKRRIRTRRLAAVASALVVLAALGLLIQTGQLRRSVQREIAARMDEEKSRKIAVEQREQGFEMLRSIVSNFETEATTPDVTNENRMKALDMISDRLGKMSDADDVSDDMRRVLAKAYYLKGVLQYYAVPTDIVSVIRLFEQALDELSRTASSEATGFDRIDIHGSMAQVLLQQGSPEKASEALAVYSAAIEELSNSDDKVRLAYERGMLAWARGMLIQKTGGASIEALAMFDEADRYFRNVTLDIPGETKYLSSYAYNIGSMSSVLKGYENLDELAGRFESAINHWESIIKIQTPWHQGNLGQLQSMLGHCRLQQGRIDDSLYVHWKARSNLQNAINGNTNDWQSQFSMCQTCADLCMASWMMELIEPAIGYSTLVQSRLMSFTHSNVLKADFIVQAYMGSILTSLGLDEDGDEGLNSSAALLESLKLCADDSVESHAALIAANFIDSSLYRILGRYDECNERLGNAQLYLAGLRDKGRLPSDETSLGNILAIEVMQGGFSESHEVCADSGRKLVGLSRKRSSILIELQCASAFARAYRLVSLIDESDPNKTTKQSEYLDLLKNSLTRILEFGFANTTFAELCPEIRFVVDTSAYTEFLDAIDSRTDFEQVVAKLSEDLEEVKKSLQTPVINAMPK